ncbi:hypothetical protein [Spirillospora sp. NBC_01491]|uniref:hypothetical protein n=1 Tax=Spirillospora sp. NBC_01491 TaxID=2976007 RepID=UPI002E36C6A9|nr:hypothetical protein [Spirillospora sp. NBC_01491]
MGNDVDLVETRRALHGVAELVLAGPQYRQSGTIRLAVRAGGFCTTERPDLAVEGAVLVAGSARIPLDGATFAALGAAAGVEAGAPQGLYEEGGGARPGDVATVDAGAAGYIEECFVRGDAALTWLGQVRPVLWPEHFDLGITLDEVNYGVSPGDGHLAEPYAYVGPWKARAGDFWNAPFGATRPMRLLPDAGALRGFFEEGRARSAADPVQRP